MNKPNHSIGLISEDELAKISLKNLNFRIYKVIDKKIENKLKLNHAINLVNREKLTVTLHEYQHFCETNFDRDLNKGWLRGDGRKFIFFEEDSKLFVSVLFFSDRDGLNVSVYDINDKYIDEIILSKQDRIIVNA